VLLLEVLDRMGAVVVIDGVRLRRIHEARQGLGVALTRDLAAVPILGPPTAHNVCIAGTVRIVRTR